MYFTGHSQGPTPMRSFPVCIQEPNKKLHLRKEGKRNFKTEKVPNATLTITRCMQLHPVQVIQVSLGSHLQWLARYLECSICKEGTYSLLLVEAEENPVVQKTSCQTTVEDVMIHDSKSFWVWDKVYSQLQKSRNEERVRFWTFPTRNGIGSPTTTLERCRSMLQVVRGMLLHRRPAQLVGYSSYNEFFYLCMLWMRQFPLWLIDQAMGHAWGTYSYKSRWTEYKASDDSCWGTESRRLYPSHASVPPARWLDLSERWHCRTKMASLPPSRVVCKFQIPNWS